MDTLTSDTIQPAWWALPVVGVAIVTLHHLSRTSPNADMPRRGMVGCLVGAFVPVSKSLHPSTVTPKRLTWEACTKRCTIPCGAAFGGP